MIMLTTFASIHDVFNTYKKKSSTSSTSSKSFTYIPICSICGAERGLIHVLGVDLFYCAEHVGRGRA